jgi:hypothetical protein
MAAIVFGAIGVQSFWIARELDGVKASLARIEGTVLTALDRRVTRLEERV